MATGRQSKKSKNKLLSKFLKVFVLAFITLSILVGVGTGVAWLISKNMGQGSLDGLKGNKVEELKKITTFAVFGLDEQKYRTDVVMLLFFNSETKKINIVSIPRDTMVTIPDDMYEEIQERRSSVEQTIKINEIPAYVEPEERNEASVEIIEATLGVDIDYYMSMDLDGFKEIVDIVGPIEMIVPVAMKYSDPAQELYIDLDAGLQYLDGEKAEQLVRFRKGYANGDLGRIDMQHEFMVAFLNQLLSTENKMNILNIAKSALVHIETNFITAIDYINYIDDISKENILIGTLPGETKTIGRSYFIHNSEETKALFDAIINDTPVTPEEAIVEPEIQIDAKTLNISVQNGTNIAGLAGNFKSKLLEEGYKVAEAIDYDNKPVEKTKIIVPSESVGQTLAQYFNKDAIIEVKEDLLDEANQAIVILGESEGE